MFGKSGIGHPIAIIFFFSSKLRDPNVCLRRLSSMHPHSSPRKTSRPPQPSPHCLEWVCQCIPFPHASAIQVNILSLFYFKTFIRLNVLCGVILYTYVIIIMYTTLIWNSLKSKLTIILSYFRQLTVVVTEGIRKCIPGWPARSFSSSSGLNRNTTKLRSILRQGTY